MPRLIEKSKFKFVLTGSSARKLRKSGQNLLAGRALTYYLYPLTTRELEENFNIEHSLRYGSLPCVYPETDPSAYLESYIKTYLQEEIQQEGLTRNLAAFSRLLESASFSQGSGLNVSSIARECAVERKAGAGFYKKGQKTAGAAPEVLFCGDRSIKTVNPRELQ